jgi:hypothetical protein
LEDVVVDQYEPGLLQASVTLSFQTRDVSQEVWDLFVAFTTERCAPAVLPL